MPHPVDIEVGATILRLRATRGFSRARLGRMVGVGFQQIRKYETGENRVSASMLYKIAGALRVPVPYLFGNFAKQTVIEPPEDILLASAFERIESAKVRTAMFRLVLAYAKTHPSTNKL